MAEKLIFTFHEMQVCYQKTLVPHPTRRAEHGSIVPLSQRSLRTRNKKAAGNSRGNANKDASAY